MRPDHPTGRTAHPGRSGDDRRRVSAAIRTLHHHRDHRGTHRVVLDPLDYNAFLGVLDAVTRLAQIARALLLFVWICRYLHSPASSRGSPAMALAVAAAGMSLRIAASVLALQPFASGGLGQC